MSRTPAVEEDLRLEGERIFLRPLTMEDADAIFEYASDREVTRFLAWDPVPDRDSVLGFVQEQIEKRRAGESLVLAIVLRETGAMIGSTDLMGLTRSARLLWPGARRAELGYLLARRYWGRGLMTEAARLTVAYGFEKLELSQSYGWVDTDNQASRQILENLGMRLAGSEVRDVKGIERPYLRYEIDAREWPCK